MAASALTLDLTGLARSGVTVPGITVAFALLACMSAWQFYEMNRELHAADRHMHITAQGKRLAGYADKDWCHFLRDPNPLRVIGIDAVIAFEIANRGTHSYRVSALYVEVYQTRTCLRPLRRLVCRLDADEEVGGSAEWLFAPEGGPIRRENWVFVRTWESGQGPAQNVCERVEMDLVAEIGGPDRKARARVQKPKVVG